MSLWSNFTERASSFGSSVVSGTGRLASGAANLVGATNVATNITAGTELVSGAIEGDTQSQQQLQQAVQNVRERATEITQPYVNTANTYIAAVREVVPQELAALRENPAEYGRQHLHALAEAHSEFRTNLLNNNGTAGSLARLGLTIGQDLDASTGLLTATGNGINWLAEQVGSDVRVRGDRTTHFSQAVTDAERHTQGLRDRGAGADELRESGQAARNSVLTQGRSDRGAAVIVENTARDSVVFAGDLLGKSIGIPGGGNVTNALIEASFQTLERHGIMSQQINVETGMPGASVGSGLEARGAGALTHLLHGDTNQAGEIISGTRLSDGVGTIANFIPIPGLNRIPGVNRAIDAIGHIPGVNRAITFVEGRLAGLARDQIGDMATQALEANGFGTVDNVFNGPQGNSPASPNTGIGQSALASIASGSNFTLPSQAPTAPVTPPIMEARAPINPVSPQITPPDPATLARVNAVVGLGTEAITRALAGLNLNLGQLTASSKTGDSLPERTAGINPNANGPSGQGPGQSQGATI